MTTFVSSLVFAEFLKENGIIQREPELVAAMSFFETSIAVATGEVSRKAAQARLDPSNITIPKFLSSVSALSLRNAGFSSSVLMSNPLTKAFMESHGEEICENTGLSSDRLEQAVKLSVTAMCVAITTPFDNIATQFLGTQSPSKTLSNAAKNPRTMIAGAAARTAFGSFSSVTIQQALKQSDSLTNTNGTKEGGNEGGSGRG
ncbi:MAG: hypothetical protein O3B09_01775 [Proteobacteria bacterium]|nr:hypothetical protein [Pseudomonadota bacterium]